jgi:hypothetical protein
MARWAVWIVVGMALNGCRASRESLTAGHIGCRPSEVSTYDAGSSSGWSQSAETWIAECRGRRFVCSEVTTSSFDIDWSFTDAVDSVDSDVSCREELGESHAAVAREERAGLLLSTSAPPAAGGGFELGMDRAAARGRCEAAGHAWRDMEGPEATCSGTATAVGFAASAKLTFCKGSLCTIAISHTPSANWARSFSELKASLTTKYGKAGERQLRIPSMCRADEQFDRCARDGALNLAVSWKWPNGQRLRLSLGRPSPHAGLAEVRLTYVGPRRLSTLDVSAL